MAIYDIPVRALDGSPASLRDHAGKVLLLDNVASQCGLTPQYAERGFAVIGVPCNQFGEQEPGSSDEIQTFCTTNYGVTFPLLEKCDVNGEARHPLYAALTELTDDSGHTGDIRWNFEKFLVNRAGEPVLRFSPLVDPESVELVEGIEKLLAD